MQRDVYQWTFGIRQWRHTPDKRGNLAFDVREGNQATCSSTYAIVDLYKDQFSTGSGE